MNNNPYKNIKNYQVLFGEIRKRPGMWLGSTSLTALEHQLQGQWFAETYYEIEFENRMSGFDFDKFEEWVEKKFNPKRLVVKSYYLARKASSSEEEAFYLWFNWYDDFLSECKN